MNDKQQSVEKPRKCMICGYERYCNNCVANGDNHKAMFPQKQPFELSQEIKDRSIFVQHGGVIKFADHIKMDGIKIYRTSEGEWWEPVFLPKTKQARTGNVSDPLNSLPTEKCWEGYNPQTGKFEDVREADMSDKQQPDDLSLFADCTPVPTTALKWLFGEEGSFEKPEGAKGNYWWRSIFRKMIDSTAMRSYPPKREAAQPVECAKAQENAWNEDCDYVCDVLDSKERAWQRGFVKAWEVFSDRLTKRESVSFAQIRFWAEAIEKQTWTEFSGNELHAHQVALGYCRSNAKIILELLSTIEGGK